MAGQYTSINGIATVTPQSATVKVADIEYVCNDDDVNILYVSFSNEDADYIAIMPQERMYDFPSSMSVGVLWYKSSAGNVNFRFLGSK